MKISRYFLIACLLLLLCAYLIVSNKPHHFDWDETYKVQSHHPFGTLLFDSLMKQSLPKGYTPEYIYNEQEFLGETLSERGDMDFNLLIICKSFYITMTEDLRLYNFALRGGKVLIATSNFDAEYHEPEPKSLYEEEEEDNANSATPTDLKETALSPLLYLQDYDYYQHSTLTTLRYLAGMGYDAFTFKSTLLAHDQYPETDVSLARPLVTNHFFTETAKERDLQPLDSFRADAVTFPVRRGGDDWSLDPSLVEDKVELTSAVKRKIGKGCIIYTTAARYFTNYGMASKDGRTYVLRLMQELSDKPTLRIVREGQQRQHSADEEELGFYAFSLQHPPFSLSLRLAAIGALLALFVNARRRSRAIPLKKLQPNVTLHFLRQVALLYRAHGDYTDLLHKRFLVFADNVKRRTGINLAETNARLTDDDLQRLARHIGQKPELLRGTLQFLNEHLTRETPVTFRQYHDCVDDINRLTRLL